MTSKKKNEDEKESGEGGSTGIGSGEIHFRYKDILSTGPRDDVLPQDEIKRLLIVHQDSHKDRVEKQKLMYKERQALKEGRTSVRMSVYDDRKMGYNFSGASASPHKEHPILTRKAQFSGIDRQVTSLPTENQADTNLDAKEKLENQYRLRHAPKFNPKPRPY
jgi:hypothetical protein